MTTRQPNDKAAVRVRKTDGRSSEGTKLAIRWAAARRFALNAYADVTLRDIAADVGVTAPLIIRYFGSKEALCFACADFSVVFRQLRDRPESEFGAALADYLLGYVPPETRSDWLHDPQSLPVNPFLVLLFISTRTDAPEELLSQLRQPFLEPLAAQLTGDDAELRAELILSVLVGVSAAMRVLRLPMMVAESQKTLAEAISPLLQVLVDGLKVSNIRSEFLTEPSAEG